MINEIKPINVKMRAVRVKLSYGISLAELLISIGLGLTLVTGLALFYQQMISTNESILQETALTLSSNKAFNAIDFAVEHSGYIPNKNLGLEKKEVYRKTALFERGETFIAGQFSNNDKILVRTIGEKNITFSDCLGEEVTENEYVEMGFYVTDNNKLICKSTHISNTIDPYRAVIADNVDVFRVTQFGTNENESLQFIIPPFAPTPEKSLVKSLLVEIVAYTEKNIYQSPKTQILTYSDSSQITIISRQKYTIASKHMIFYNH